MLCTIPMSQNLVNSCWAAYSSLLQAEGVTQANLQQAWQAVCSSISTSTQHGRGHKLTGLCTVLPAAGGVKVLLSDTLLKLAPQLQLGQGCVHHASVRQQVQGVDTVNTASLAHRCSQGLNQDKIKLALRTLLDTVGKQLTARQACVVDLGVGQLRFAAGATLAEFKASASWWCTAVRGTYGVQQDIPAVQQCSSAPVHAQPTPRLSESHSLCGKKVEIQQSNASSSSSHTGQHSSSKAVTSGPLCFERAAAAAASLHFPSATTAVPEKPSNCNYDPDAAWEIAREVRTAAVQNRRAKAAVFVLPAGGPGEAEETRMPQGKAKANALTVGKQQVVAAAAIRSQQEAAERSSQEAATLKLQACRLSVLNKQAQAHVQHKKAQKQQLAADLAQQMQDRLRQQQQRHSLTDSLDERPLVVCSKPDAATMMATKRKQQAQYRACLDAQLADAGAGRQEADLLEMQEVQQRNRQMVKAALGDTNEV